MASPDVTDAASALEHHRGQVQEPDAVAGAQQTLGPQQRMLRVFPRDLHRRPDLELRPLGQRVGGGHELAAARGGDVTPTQKRLLFKQAVVKLAES